MVTKLQNINDLPEVDANAGAKVGEALEKAAKIIKPVVEVAKKIVNNVGPVLEKGVQWCEEKYPIIEPYNPTELLPAIIGLVLVFYGGHFMLTVSAVEAFRMIGYQDVKEALIVFHKNWKAIQVANQKDNTIDADGDGIADVEQITAKEKTSRKMLLVLRTIDPAEVQKAYHACLMSWGAIIVTLKMNFAEAITLGASIGQMLEKLVTPFVAPPLKKLMDDDFHKWIPISIDFVTKSIGVSIAWSIFRVIGAWYTAVRGATLFVKGLLKYLKDNNFIDWKVHEASLTFNACAFCLAVLGFYLQVSSEFSMAFPMNLLLTPFNMLETTLYYSVNFT